MVTCAQLPKSAFHPTGITVAVVLIAKFTENAWITVLLIPALILSGERLLNSAHC